MKILFLAIFVFSSSFVSWAVTAPYESISSAQSEKGRNPAPASNEQPTAKGQKEGEALGAMVLSAHNAKTRGNEFKLGDTLVLAVQNLQEVKEKEKNDNRKLILYINNVPMKGLFRDGLDVAKGEVRFPLVRDATTKNSWDKLICRPTPQIKTDITAGFDDDTTIPTKVSGDNALYFNIINIKGFLVWLGLTFLLGWGFIRLGRTTPLLRTAGVTSAYSLAYSQMAFWTFLVCSAYVLIYMITLDMPDLPSSILILLGLSSGTALAGKVVDDGHPVPPSKGRFLSDILQDADGYTVARIQIFVWTVIMAGIFISNIYQKLAMPDFSDTLLALMGISSGTYIGFKIPEQKISRPPTPGASAAPAESATTVAPTQTVEHKTGKDNAGDEEHPPVG